MYFNPVFAIKPNVSFAKTGLLLKSVCPVEQESTQKSGINSSVSTPPPGLRLASTTTTFFPALAKYAAVIKLL